MHRTPTCPGGEIILRRVTGEVDVFTIDILRDALEDSLKRCPSDLVVDLAGLTFCTASGVAPLVCAGQTATKRGIRHALGGTPAYFDRVDIDVAGQ